MKSRRRVDCRPQEDVVDIVEPTETEARTYDAFPLPREGGPWLCTQASGGLLSHYAHASTFHAVDFRCPEGTPCLAIADGVIHAVDVSHKDGGIHVSELFRWNAVTLKLDDGHYAEYVHVSSSACKVGDRVRKGDIIGATGAVGFCPEPHLHLEVHAVGGEGRALRAAARAWATGAPGQGGGRVRGGLAVL